MSYEQWMTHKVVQGKPFCPFDHRTVQELSDWLSVNVKDDMSDKLKALVEELVLKHVSNGATIRIDLVAKILPRGAVQE